MGINKMSTTIPPVPPVEDGIALIPPYVPAYGPTPNITPFTYRDGMTYLQILQGMRYYINNTLVPAVNNGFDEVSDIFVTEINRLIDEMNAIIDDILNSAAGVNDPIVAGIFDDNDSLTREVTDKLYGGYVNVKSFGAIGDGITDDTNAIQAADTYAASTKQGVYFPGGRYPATVLTLTSAWNMDAAATLVYNGIPQANFLTCSTSNVDSGDISIDFANRSPHDGFVISGNGNRFGKITVKNMLSGTDLAWLTRGVYITGTDNVISEVVADDFVNNGNTANDSMPQPFVLSGSATRNVIDAVISNNVTSTVVDNSIGSNIIGKILATNGKDNGLYVVAAGNCSVGEIIYEGANSSAGFRHGSYASIGKIIHIGKSGATGPVVFFGDCGNITIGEIVARGVYAPILSVDDADAGRINIGSVKGTLIDAHIASLQRDKGDVQYLTIDTFDVTVTLTATFTGSERSLMRFDAAKGINFGVFNIKVIFNGITTSNPFYFRIRDAFTYKSFIRSLKVEFLEQDYITPHDVTFFGTGFSAASVDGPFTQPNLEISEGVISDSNQLRTSQYSTWQMGRLVRTSVPTTGTWRKGHVFWADAPSAGHTMFVCSVAGTPGTWITV
jgi:hypothetical protein